MDDDGAMGVGLGPAQGLPRGGGAQGRHRVDPGLCIGPSGARGQGAAAPVARPPVARARPRRGGAIAFGGAFKNIGR